LENEDVVQSVVEKYADALSITFQKKFWPHIDKTGGFFITKIHKNASLPKKENTRKRSGSNEKIKRFRGTLSSFSTKKDIELYEYENKVLALKNIHTLNGLEKEVFFMRFGEYVGEKK
jgi:hypothetical protein